jgi:hypothetical protein
LTNLDIGRRIAARDRIATVRLNDTIIALPALRVEARGPR